MKILLVEDDSKLTLKIQQALQKENYSVDTANNGIDGEFLGNEKPFDLIILDLGLPQRPGKKVLKNWRESGNKTPVLILTARNDWSERVAGLKMGADDYLGKPFFMEELLARVSAVIRRCNGEASSGLSQAGIFLDEERQIAISKNGDEHSLTHVEYRLLHYFMTHPGIILSKNRLIEHIYEGDSEHDNNVIEVYVRRLRNKLGKEVIVTRRYQGYIFQKDSS